MIEPTREQQEALLRIQAWFLCHSSHEPDPIFLLDGGAGTGKTTVASLAVESLKLKRVVYGAYTAKAAHVMHQNGMTGARTLHSLLYTLSRDKDGRFVWHYLGTRGPMHDAQLIVIDECSMVNAGMRSDILAYSVPVLVLGDVRGQLPPISGTGAFYTRSPDFTLSEPHRFAMQSDITKAAWLVRHGSELAYNQFTDSDAVTVLPMTHAAAWDHITDGDNIVIVGKHKTRFTVTRRCRNKYGFKGRIPCAGEPIICIKNSYAEGFHNGMVATVWRVSSTKDSETFQADLMIDGEMHTDVRINRLQFNLTYDAVEQKYDRMEHRKGAEFDWGYALTAHKAQGSEWDNVVVIDDQFARWDPDLRRRWLYTAVTRASNKLVVLKTGR
jgi:exodeoxyribonuclease V